MSDRYRYLIIVAGGKGRRMGAAVPKQFLLLAGRPMIFHTIDRFLEYDPYIELIIVLPQDSVKYWQHLCNKYGFRHHHNIVAGGQERFNSVKNGLSLVRQESLVAVHDAVRPRVSIETIDRCFSKAEKKGNAVPFISPAESVRLISDSGANSSTDRRRVALIQTPQVFRSDILLAAYARVYDPSFTDDASVVEAAGYKINLVDGNRENIKITTAEDLEITNAIMTIQ
ncbi:MAG: 2-C-methyl-D-erythritol 4-phosphate cytidylyltransferase [Bacteroidales bacterium]